MRNHDTSQTEIGIKNIARVTFLWEFFIPFHLKTQEEYISGKATHKNKTRPTRPNTKPTQFTLKPRQKSSTDETKDSR
jgi:hypothetical protein